MSHHDENYQDIDAQRPALIDYMEATTTPHRDAAFLRTYAERVRNRTAASWEIPNTVASTLDDIAERISDSDARLASAEALIAEIATKGCIMRVLDSMPDCAESLPDGFLCGPCRARRWKEAQG